MAFPTVPLIYVAAASYFLYNLCLVLWRGFQPGLRNVPGPTYARFTNLVLKWNVLGGKRTKYIHYLHERYGNMVRIAPEEVAVANISAFHEIHKIGTKYVKSHWYRDLNHNSTSQIDAGIFAMSDTHIHARRRKMFSAAFSKSSIVQWEEQIKGKVNMAVRKIKRDATAGAADILMWWTFLAADVTSDLAFGESFDMLAIEKKTNFIEDLEVALLVGGLRAEFMPLMPILTRVPIPALQRVWDVFKRFKEYGQVAVENAKSASASANRTLFSKILAEAPSKEELSDASISSEATNLIIAGSDTTATTLTYLVWAVLVHSKVNEKLQAEVQGCSTNPTFKELEALPYMNKVIDETLRLYSAAPGSLPRIVPAGGAILGGYHIPGGTTVSTQAYTFHRNPKIFPNPESFDPDRWTDPSREMRDAFMPWGAGSRSCLGVHIAKMELFHATFAFFRACPNAEVAPATTKESMETVDYFLIKPAGNKCEVTLPS